MPQKPEAPKDRWSTKDQHIADVILATLTHWLGHFADHPDPTVRMESALYNTMWGNPFNVAGYTDAGSGSTAMWQSVFGEIWQHDQGEALAGWIRQVEDETRLFGADPLTERRTTRLLLIGKSVLTNLPEEWG